MVLVEAVHLTKKQKDGFAVNAISFTQNAGEKIAIAGETGSGKTSLLKMIGGLLQPDDGQVLFDGKRVEGPLEQLIPGHPKIAYLSQYFELRNNYEVHELLEMAGHLDDHEIIPLFQLCRIQHLLNRKTMELSGGEKQRVVLAMQLVKKPALLLLDEPFSNMDAIHTTEMKAVVHDVAEEKGVSIIMVSHNGKDVLPWADTIYIMQAGSFVQTGTPHEIYHQPANAYCAGLFGEYSEVPAPFFERLHIPVQKTDAKSPMIVRPEHLKITSSHNYLPVVVQQSFFMGAVYLLQVVHNETTFRIQSNKPYEAGTELYIRYQ
jgi:ABC-type sugar transport system ATPase subunit